MPSIFISYRRDDAISHAGRLFDWLVRQFGPEQVFLDTQSIAPGTQFPPVLRERLEQSDVLLVVIGPRWASIADGGGRRRLDDPQDFVRLEVSSGLARAMRTLPVLVGGARMPSADQLPSELATLATLNALSIDDLHFEQDFDNLVDAVLDRPRGFVRRELDRLRRLLLVAKASTLIAPPVALALLFAAWMQVFDFFALDTRAASYSMWLGEQFAHTSAEVPLVLVTIDEATEQRYGGFGRGSAWRARHGELIGRLARAGARSVVFDMYIESESHDGPQGDETMAAQIRAAQKRGTSVVVGAAHVHDGIPTLLRPLREAGASWGSLCISRQLGLVFAAPLAVVHGAPGESLRLASAPALALVAVHGQPRQMHADAERRVLQLSADAGAPPASVGYSKLETIRISLGDCTIATKGETVASLLLPLASADYWRDPRRRVSYADALEMADDTLSATFRGRIALVGDTREHGPDRISVVRGFQRQDRFGVELHADAIAALGSGKTVRPPGVGGQWVWMVLLFLVGAVASFQLYGRARWVRTATLAGVVLLYLSLVAAAYAAFGWLLNALYDAVAFISGYWLLGRLQRLSMRSRESAP